ncbi:TPA: hypothetical protein N3A33_005321, partial [Salmonella enterica subsp. salamae serovar 28:r:e,n,z15]|nr:hypothetical protein [Salmonella enterica subsp. salamae serovar 28:r:e,n,z15]
NITLAADISTDIAAGKAVNLTLQADRDITLNGNITTAGDGKGALNVNLLASGTTNGGTVNLGSATVSLNGGDLVLDSAGVAAEGSPAGNTIKVSSGAANLTVGNLAAGNVSDWTTAGLNVSAAGNITVDSTGTVNISRAGSSTLSGQNINLSGNGFMFACGTGDGSLTLNATTGDLNLTVKGTGNVNNTDGGNITLQAAQDVNMRVNSSGAGTLLYLGGLNVSAGHDIMADVTTTSGGNYNLIRGDGATLAAGNTISLAAAGSRTANGNNASINLNAASALTAKSITLNGSSTKNGAGVTLDNVTLTADSLNITGVSQGGTGYGLTNLTLSDNLQDLGNVTLSSAGSSADTTNLLDNSLVTTASRNSLITRGTENDTLINMNGTALFSDNTGGWLADGSGVDKTGKTGSWIFSNTSVTAGGDVSLTGVSVGFSNATLTLAQGSLTLNTAHPLNLAGSTVTVSNGNISLGTTQGDLSVTNTTLAQRGAGNTTLNAAGNLTVTGGTLSVTNLNLTSAGTQKIIDSTVSVDGGNITLNASGGTEGNGVLVQNTTLFGSNVSVNGSTASVSPDAYGVSLQNVTLNAVQADITGVATNTAGGAGFILANMTLQGGVADLSNLTLGSAGSSAGTVNSLDCSIIRNGTDLADIMSRNMGSTTAVEASSLSLTFDSNGWDNTGGTSTATLPSGMNTAHDWVLNNASVTSGGNVTLKGVSFSHSTLDVTGTLKLSSDNWLTLRGDTVNTTGGSVLQGAQGMTLGDLTGNSALTADTAELMVSGNLSNATLNVSGDTAMSDSQNLTLTNVTLQGATSGEGAKALTVNAGGTFTVTGGSLTAGNISVDSNSIMLSGTGGGLTLNATTGDLNLTVNGTGNINNTDGGNITLHAGRDVNMRVNSSAAGTLLYLGGLNVSAGHDIMADVTTTSGGSYNLIRGDGATLAAGNDISLAAAGGRTANGNNASINLNAASALAAKNITLNGSSTKNGAGVTLDNVTLTADSLNITGVSQGGTGYGLTNLTLSDNLQDLSNVTLSSAGSSADTMNRLDNTVVSAVITNNTLDAFLLRGADNLTQIDMNGSAIFSNTSSGWIKNYTSTDRPYGGWLFNGTSVTAGGDVDLKGVGFGNASINVTAGNFSIENNGPLMLAGSTVNVSSGNLSLGTTEGDLTLSNTSLNATAGQVNISSGGNLAYSKGNISAKNDITLSAAGGNITVGGNGKSVVNLASTDGNITLAGGNAAGNGVTVINNATLNASSGNVSLVSLAPDTLGVGINVSASNITAVNFLLDNGQGVAKVNDSYNRAVVLRGNSNITVTGDAIFNVTGSQNYSMATNAIIKAGNITVTSSGATLSLQSNTVLNAAHNITLNGTISKAGKNAVESSGSNISLTAENILVNGTNANTGSGASGVVLDNTRLSSDTLNITGVTQGYGGYGFSLGNNVTLAGNVAGNLSNLTLNSAGSAAGNTNIIGDGIINSQERFNDITTRKLGLMTQVNGTYWSGNNQTYTSGLTLNAAEGTDGWLYSGVNVTVSGGDTVLNNMGFAAPAVLNISGSSLTIDNTGPVTLSGDN